MFLSDFYKADFHIHTPESHCFYQTSEAKEEDFKKLLKGAKQNGVDVLAIADHNTIDGYKYILQMKEKYTQELETITRYGLKSESTIDVDEFVSLFSEILILPGVEYETRDGIHLILIFNPEIGIADINDFLTKGGITPDIKGHERKGCGKWHVENVFEEASGLDPIIFAAHAERDKGLLKEIKHTYRQEILRSDNLHGLEFKSLPTREHIKSLLKDPAYQRKYELALIQNSDYHNKVNETIGNPCTYIHLEEKAFSHIKDAFLNSAKKITSPEQPEIDFLLRRLEKDDRTYFLDDYKDEMRLIKAVIGLANLGSGNILIGENFEKKRIGLDDSEIETARPFIRNLVQQNIEPVPRIDFTDLKINKKSILALGVKSRAFAVYFEKKTNEIYVWEENKPRPAERNVVTELLKDNFKRETNKFLSQKIKRIENLSAQMKKLRDDLEGMYITYKFDRSPFTLGEIFDFLFVNVEIALEKAQELNKYKREIEELNKKFGNGMHRGNTVFVREFFPPRLDSTVLRHSAPVYEFKQDIKDLLPDIPFKGEKLVLVPGGGTFYSKEEDKFFTPDMIYGNYTNPIVFLRLRQEYTSCYSPKYLLAYLKSAPLLWLSLSLYDSINIYKPNIITKLPAPLECTKLDEMDKIMDQIMDLEDRYLKAEEGERFIMKKSGDMDQYNKSVRKKRDDHNNSVNAKYLQVDQHFIEQFNISEEEKMLMCGMLKTQKIFVNENL